MLVWTFVFLLMITSGFLSQNHPGQSVAFWREACNQNRANSCLVWVGKLATNCRRGSADACVALGEAVQAGQVVPKDQVRAGEAFHRGCELGSEAGCEALATFIRERGDQQLTRACDQGDGISCWIVASIYADGKVVIADYRRSIQLFARSCDSGWFAGCGRLGESYLHGQGTTANFVRAAEYFDKACEGNDALSCLNSAAMYTKGIGVLADTLRARRRLGQACGLGMLSGCRTGERTE